MSFPKWLCRQEGIVKAKEAEVLANSHIAVAGLGGVGGICAEIIVRSGIGKISVADFDKFDRTNFNRQANSSARTLGRNKASEFCLLAKAINKKIKARKFAKKINEENAPSFAKHASIVIDCLDNLYSRVILFRECKRRGIPYVYAAATGHRGMVSVFLKNHDLEKTFNLPCIGKKGRELESSLIHYPQCQIAWGPATNLAGVLAANAALNFILGKPYPKCPEFWMIDTFSKRFFWKEKLP